MDIINIQVCHVIGSWYCRNTAIIRVRYNILGRCSRPLRS